MPARSSVTWSAVTAQTRQMSCAIPGRDASRGSPRCPPDTAIGLPPPPATRQLGNLRCLFLGPSVDLVTIGRGGSLGRKSHSWVHCHELVTEPKREEGLGGARQQRDSDPQDAEGSWRVVAARVRSIRRALITSATDHACIGHRLARVWRVAVERLGNRAQTPIPKGDAPTHPERRRQGRPS